MQSRCWKCLFYGLLLTGSLLLGQGVAAEDPIPGLVKQLQGTDPTVRMQSVAMLGDWGPAAKPAVPALVKLFESSEDLGLKHEVLIALGKIGPAAGEAVPTLTATLKSDSPLLQHEAIQSLRKIGEAAQPAVPELKSLLQSQHSFLQVAAAWALAELIASEDTTQKLVPLLVEGLGDENSTTRGDAVFALGAIGEPAVSSIQKVVASNNVNQVISGVDALGLMGAAAEPSIPLLLQRMNQTSVSNPTIAWHVAHALGEIGAQPEKVVPALIRMLSSKDATLQIHSAVALGKFGPEAASAVPELVKLLSAKDPSLRVIAATTLGEIGPAAKDAVPALAKAINDEVGVVTFRVAEALGEIGKPAVPVLIDLLDEPGLQLLAAPILGRIGSDAKAAVPAMAKLLSSEDKDLTRELLLSLAEMGPDAIEAKPALLELMKSEHPEAQAGAVFVLAKIGAEDALPQIQELLKKSENPLVRLSCAGAIITFNPDHPNATVAVPYFRTALKEGTVLAKREVARLLARLGEKGKEAIPELIEAASSDEDPEVRAAAMYALSEVGTPADQLVPVAIRGLQDPFPPVRTTSAYALSQLGQQAAEAVPALQAMTKSQNTFEQLTGAWALTRIETNPENRSAALELLVERAMASTPEVRIQLAESLGEIGLRLPKAKEVLAKLAQDQDERVSKAAEQALQKLKEAEKATPQDQKPPQ